MSSDDSDELVTEAAESVAWNQDVQWDRYARLATPAGRRLLDNLRALAPVFASRDTARPPTVTEATAADAGAGVLARLGVNAITAIAAIEVAAALLVLPWAWDDYHREHGDLAAYLTALLLAHSGSACLLLIAGRRDRRIWLLGIFFLLKATHPPQHILPAFLGLMPPPHVLQDALFEAPASTVVFLSLYARPFLFAPAFLWAFAREYPRLRRRTRLDDLARRMIPVSAAIGLAIAVGVPVLYLTRAVGEATFAVVLEASLAIPNSLSLAAVAVVALRAHTAPAAEVRRVVLFSAGFLLWLGVMTAHNIGETFSPGYWVFDYEWTPPMLLAQLARFPGMLLLWYSVVAVRIPHPREVARRVSRQLLMRRGRLWLAAGAPAVALVWLVMSRPERAVGAVVADPLAQSLFAAAGIMLVLLAGREELLGRLDAWLYPETPDQRRVLVSATARLAQAGRIATVGHTVTRTVRRGCGSTATLLLAGDTDTHGRGFSAPDARAPPLSGTSAIVHMLETAGGALRVHPHDETSIFVLLPPEEAEWVVESAADVIVPVPGPGAELIGILVAGRRFDDRTLRSVDVPFLEVLGAAAGLAVARLLLMEAPGAPSPEPSPARECPACRCVTGPGDPPACDCGSAYVEIAAPELLAGKFRLTRRLGAGGMGAVYLAGDLRLGRDVAVKTLAGTSVSRLMGLKPEAWAMATVTHGAVAQIHAIESWRGRPFLVVEYLPGGTLADRLRRGGVAPGEAVAMAAVLGDALAALHRVGYLHGDVKPSNIGFTAEGLPKLLDFGLARGTNDADAIGGTVRYLSPEVLSGRPAEDADDVWSLCVVLHEMVSGRHPFAGGGADADEVTGRIRRRHLARGAWSGTDSEPPPAVLAFTASVLSAARSARPATARGFVDALHGMVTKR